jgi:crossover junction endodeoxyribonuclease RuvC
VTPPLVLGIDPGLRVCGWGLVAAGAKPSYVDCGVIRPSPKQSLANRLQVLHAGVSDLLARHQPDEMAVEDPFVGSLNPASALAIGQARAVAVLAGAQAGIEVAFYAPRAVKAAVAGYGGGDKQQVQAMVKLLLDLETAPWPYDAADALAVALCHLSHRRAAALTRP